MTEKQHLKEINRLETEIQKTEAKVAAIDEKLKFLQTLPLQIIDIEAGLVLHGESYRPMANKRIAALEAKIASF